MKKMPTAILIALAFHSRLHGQGTLEFGNDFTALSGQPAPVTISTLPGMFNPNDGPAGAYVGSNYTASLFFLNGTVTDQAVFDSSAPVLFNSADTKFAGTTGTGPGHGFSGDGSGFFYRGIYLGAASGQAVTVQVRAWYNGGGIYASYAQALAAGHNVGESNPIGLTLGTPPGPAPNLEGLLAFTVGIPEPSTFTIGAFAGLCLLLLCRRRSAPARTVPRA